MSAGSVFERLTNMPKEHPFWWNKWHFSRSVFTNESWKGEFDSKEAAFMAWLSLQRKPFIKYVHSAPSVDIQPDGEG